MPQTFEDLTPQNFSFNSPLGWCEACQGLGVEQGTNQQAVVASPGLSLRQGAVSAWPRPEVNPPFARLLEALGREFEIPLDTPWYLLDPKHQRVVLYGSERWVRVDADSGQPSAVSGQRGEGRGQKSEVRGGKAKRQSSFNPQPSTLNPQPSALNAFSFQYKGIYPAIEEASRVSYDYRMKLQDLVGEKPCSICHGDRVRPDAAAVQLRELTLPQLSRLPLMETLRFLETLELTPEQQKVAGDLLHEATHRLKFLVDVGLHYLTLDRGMPTLSGGESQRIRLAGQIGRALTGVLYVLDEPTIGLHPRDNGRLIEALHRLRDLGNTVVLVEHDQEVLEAADRLYDFGPGSGRFGGTVTAEGTPRDVAKQGNKSLTGAYLAGEQGIPIPVERRIKPLSDVTSSSVERRASSDEVTGPSTLNAQRSTTHTPPPGGTWLEITGCRQNNLRGVDLQIPLGALTCVTGLSGSGKSSLIQETLARAVVRKLNRTGDAPGPYDELRGVEHISRVINVDQAPIGMTPASNPATYVGVFDPIRELFTRLPDSKIRGYKPGRFSFNRPGGRCEECEGLGQKKIEMHFLPDVWVTCDACRGQRYNAETLAVKYKGQSISDVLNLSLGQALELFGNIPKIRAPLATLCAIGLDYLTLGQSATTLSGGEAQRVKLAAELCKPNSGRTLYLLDEPTTGLHFDDIAKLLKVLGSLVEQGNTVVVIEHNLDVIKTADWIVDVGPEAGGEGGQIVVAGTPEEVVAYALSVEGRALSVGDAGASSMGTEQRSRGDKGKRRKGAVQTAVDTQRSSPLLPCSPASLLGDHRAASTLNARPSTLNAARPRSYTGELLTPVLARGRRANIELFDVSQAAAKQQGDVDIAKVGKEAALPWKVDGRKWHTQDRPARNGKSCRWEGAALEFVVDLIGEYQGLKPVNWGDPSTVEITAEQKAGVGWFFHALTGDEWLVRFYFRVPKRSFDEERLARDLALTPVDELDEIQVYGRGERVKFNNSKGPFQEVMIDVYRLEEIDTPAFREFVEEAVAAYVAKAEQQERAPAEAVMPWKVLGRKWHLSRKGFPSNKRIAWEASLLERLLGVLEPALAGLAVDWSNKLRVLWTDAAGQVVVELGTKRREGPLLNVFAPSGAVAVGSIADLGTDRAIAPHRGGRDAVRILFAAADAVDPDSLSRLLRTVAS